MDFIGVGSELICDALCTLDPGSGGRNLLSLKKWVKDGIHGVLGFFMGTLNCPACTTLPKLEELPKGDTLVIKGDLEGDDKYLQKFKLEDKDRICGVEVKDMDKDSGGWWSPGWSLVAAGLVAAGVGAFCVVSAGAGCAIIPAAVPVIGGLTVGATTWGLAGTIVITGGIAYLATEEGANKGTAELYRRIMEDTLGEDLGDEVKTGLKGAEDVDDLKRPFKLITQAYTQSTEKMYEQRHCGEFDDQEKCTDENCYWHDDGNCHNIPEEGIARDADDISDQSFEECVEEVSGESSYDDVSVDYFVAGDEATAEEKKQASKHTAQVVQCIVLKETPITEEEIKELKEFMREMQAREAGLDQLVLDWEPGNCPLKFKTGKACDPESSFAINQIGNKGKRLLWATPWNFDTQLKNDCGKGEGKDCRVALPSIKLSSRAMKMMPAEEIPEKEEAYVWMPKGDLLCDYYGDKRWHMCNVGPHQERNYTAKVGDVEVDFTCSNYNWTLSEKGTQGSITPETL